MKLFGNTLPSLVSKDVYIPHNDQILHFKIKCVQDWAEFDKIVKMPEPPIITRAGKAEKNNNDKSYKLAIEQYNKKKVSWFYAKSLEETPGLTFDVFSFEDPNTWHTFEDELQNSGLARHEIAHLLEQIWSANTLTEDTIEKARQSFLLSQLQAES